MPRAVGLTDELLSGWAPIISDIDLVPSSGGRFEVTLDGELIFSKAALKRHAEREAEGIDVSLKEGTASLAGKVHTWAEKQAILGALKYAPGVERVNDQLSIDPYF